MALHAMTAGPNQSAGRWRASQSICTDSVGEGEEWQDAVGFSFHRDRQVFSGLPQTVNIGMSTQD